MASAKRFAKVAEEELKYGKLKPADALKQVAQLEKQMYEHARNLEFEAAAKLRDEIQHIRHHALGMPEEAAG
jgi:excinuclease ABC subunit B